MLQLTGRPSNRTRWGRSKDERLPRAVLARLPWAGLAAAAPGGSVAKTWTSETLEQGRIRQMKNFTILTIKPIYAWDFIVVGFIR